MIKAIARAYQRAALARGLPGYGTTRVADTDPGVRVGPQLIVEKARICSYIHKVQESLY